MQFVFLIVVQDPLRLLLVNHVVLLIPVIAPNHRVTVPSHLVVIVKIVVILAIAADMVGIVTRTRDDNINININNTDTIGIKILLTCFSILFL